MNTWRDKKKKLNVAKPHWASANRAKMLDLLGRCNEVGAMRRFIKITLDDEDLVTGPSGAISFSRCEKAP